MSDPVTGDTTVAEANELLFLGAKKLSVSDDYDGFPDYELERFLGDF